MTANKLKRLIITCISICFYCEIYGIDDLEQPSQDYISALTLIEAGKKTEAIPFLKKSSKGGHRKAPFDLAMLHVDGEIPNASRYKGKKYLEIAVANGNLEAKCVLSREYYQKDYPTLSYISEKSKKASEVWWVLRDASSLASILFDVFGYDKYSEYAKKTSLVFQGLWGVSTITHGSIDLYITKDYKKAITILSGAICVTCTGIEYGNIEKYKMCLSKKESLEKQIKILENKKSILENIISENAILENKNVQTGIEESAQIEIEGADNQEEFDQVWGQIHSTENELANCSLKILSAQCTNEICSGAIKDMEKGQNIKSAFLENVVRVFSKKATIPVIQHFAKLLINRTKIHLGFTPFKEQAEQTDFQSLLVQIDF